MTFLRAASGAYREVAVAAACVLATILVAGFPLLIEPRFFYTDDYQTYFMPIFHEVARLVGSGQLPFITDRIWRGGALLAEYQPAVLNPASVLLYLVISKLPAATAAAVFSLVHLGLLAAGTYFLCRALRCTPACACLAAVTAPTSEWIFYWGATDWIPALVSLAWIPWAMGFLVKLHDDSRWFIPAVLGTAMVLVSGWPFALLAMAITVAIVSALTLPWQLRGNVKRTLPVYLALLTAGLLAAPAILPMIPYIEYSERRFDFVVLWKANLAALAAVGLPFHRAIWSTFDGVKAVSLPMTYVAWFIPIVIANAGWRKMLRNPVEAGVLVLAVTFAALSTLPILGHFRWMFRLLPYYHLALIVLVAIILSRPGDDRPYLRLVPTLAAILVPVAISIAFAPGMLKTYAMSGALVMVLAAAGLAAQRFARFHWIGFFVASNIILVWAVNYNFVTPKFPTYPNAFASPFRMSEGAADERPRRHLSAYRKIAFDQDADWRELMPGNSSLFTNAISVGGYSPFDPKPYRQDLCSDYLGGSSCPDIVRRLTAPIGQRGTLLDLMRLEEVSIKDEALAADFNRATNGTWQSTTMPTGTTIFTRDLAAEPVPDPVSWMPDGTEAQVISQTPSRIVVDIKTGGGRDNEIVLARAWYPGWQAWLDGAALPVDALQGFLLRVKLPPDGHGRLEIAYTPAGFKTGAELAALGFGILIVMSALQALSGTRKARLYPRN